MPEAALPHPSWDRLYETAAAQDGLFTTRQGVEAGYSSQLLLHYVRTGRARRIRRGIYRLVHFPPGEHDELVALWLWSEEGGVFSHQTALNLHGLSDVLPSRIHLTLPGEWRRRRFRVPADVTLHHANVTPNERTWCGAVPLTAVARTLNDCASEGLSPELLHQAAQQAIARGLATTAELPVVAEALEPFGGFSE